MTVRLVSQGEPIPGYKLIERLGRGGFGEVWKAEAPGGLLKAIKFVFGEIKESKEKGSAGDQELRALNRIKTIRHPYILSLERVDIVDSQLIIVMELADRNLTDRFKECHAQGLPGIPREELLRYMEETAEALDLLNIEYQLQHLDIKPQNLFLVRNHIKVADFGLVKDLAGMKASLTGGVTPVYAAPETFEGWVSRFCDQYSLAIVYQELLTGQRPYTGASAGALLKQHMEGTPDVSPLPVGDQPIIRKALSKKGEDRFPNCMTMVQALRSSSAPAPASAAPAGPPPSVGRATMEMPAVQLPPSPATPLADQSTSHVPSPRPLPLEPITSRRGSPVVTPPPDTSRIKPRTAAPEIKGEGVLYPAVIVGLGQTGMNVLARLREAMTDQFGSVEALPNIRFLAIDIDPDAMTAAARAPRGAALAGREQLLVRLNRATYYVKPREGVAPIEEWLDPHLPYRIPRSQLTTGMRCLGRLAFMDNYREIADRLQSEIAACTEADALATADRQTKLGLRSNRPRVWVIGNLGGGTGGGMFIDTAYVVRSLLRQFGYSQPDVVGLFFVPTQHVPQWALALGNTYAALTELNHFSQPDTIFSSRYRIKEPPLADAAPPFRRCLLLPSEPDEKKYRSRIAMAAGLLLRDLTTPLGRAADRRRAEMAGNAAPPPGLTLQTFGIHRLVWPRRALANLVSRRLCARIVQHWASKEVARVKEQVVNWAKEQWEKRGMAADQLLTALKAESQKALDNRQPEDLFENIVRELVKKTTPEGNLDPAAVMAALGEIELMIGKPDDDNAPVRTPLMDALDDFARKLLGKCEQRLSEMAVHLVEQPHYRLGGAEEAIRQFTSIVQQSLEQQETLANDFMTKSNQSFSRITAMIDNLKAAVAAKRRSPVVPELVERMQVYPTLRLRGLIVQHVVIILRSLRGNCPEYLRELAYCRTRLQSMVQSFEKPLPAASALDLGPATDLFPRGCKTMDDTVTRVLTRMTYDQVIEQDTQIQAMLKKKFTALVHVCTTAANILPNVEQAMTQEVEKSIAEELSAANAVDMFLSRFDKNIDACEELAAADGKAAPVLPVEPAASPCEMSLMLIPEEEAAPRLRELAGKALPGSEIAAGLPGDDIVFYRELSMLRLADLIQTGAEARAAYQEMQETEKFTPHTRTDIIHWRLPEQK